MKNLNYWHFHYLYNQKYQKIFLDVEELLNLKLKKKFLKFILYLLI